MPWDASGVDGAPESVHHTLVGAGVVDPREEVHPESACAVDSPPGSVECHRSEIVDHEDHQCHHEGSEGASSGKSGVSGEAPRSRSPRVRVKDAKVQIGSDQLELERMASEVLKIFDELPSDILRRGQNTAGPAAKSYATGAYVLGGNVGLKANASARPEVLRTLARFIRRCAPEFRFTSINVFEEVRTERHKDQWNANLHNLAIPLTRFSGGAIFVEHAGGQDVSKLNGERGTRLPVSECPVAFNARHCWRYTEEWQGRRVIVVAYSVRHFQSLRKEHRQFLLDCGVHLPVDAPEDIHLPPVQVLAFPSSKSEAPKAPGSSPRVSFPAEVAPSSPVASQGEPGRPLKPSTALFLDIKCGSGLLAARLRKDGFQVVAMEHSRPSGRVFTHLIPVDVESEAGFSFVSTTIAQDKPFHVHFYPVTKDCFRASFVAAKSVAIATLLFQQSSQVSWSLLHPARSQFWERLNIPVDVHNICFCSGCYGAASPVQMRLCTNQSAFLGFPTPVCRCKRGPHAPGALSPDAIYSHQFCDLFAGLLQLAVGQAGLVLQPECPVQCSPQAAGVAAGKQPKLSKYQPQLEEFKCQAVVQDFPWPLPLDDKGNLRVAVGSIPPGSRLLRVTSKQGVVAAKKSDAAAGKPLSVTFGIYRTDHEFMSQALHLDHPFDLCVAVPDFMLKALAFTWKEGPVGVMRHRIGLLQKWTAWKKELMGAEKALHESMEPGVAAVMKGKSILLLEKIAASFSWPDEEVFKHLKEGFPLVGESSPSGIFDVDRKPASLTRSELFQHAKYLKPTLWAKVVNSKLDDAACHVWNATQEELLDKGWLTGPYSWEDLQARFPDGWLPVRRFGLVQKDKTRSIDDLAENSVNRAYAVSDRISLRALDELVWSAITLFKVFLAKGEVVIPLADGSRLCFQVHPFWRSLPHDRLQPSVKTVDLKSAYKQLAVSPADRCLSIVTVKDPASGQAVGFESRTLLFGATSSVVSFNRVARLVQRVLIALSCTYFDDYPVIELLPLCNNTQATICTALGLLGFVWAEDKDRPFSSEAELLGVKVDLGTFGTVKIKNKPERAEAIAAAVDSVLETGSLDPKFLPSLFGRIQFAEGQLHGRLGRLALADLRSCTLQAQSRLLDETARQALSNLRARVLGGTPRIVPALVGYRRSVIFTDDAYEPSSVAHPATVGGILYHYDNGAWCTFYFACAISLSIVQSWEALGKRHLIGPVEMYAVLCARWTVRPPCRGLLECPV